MHFRVRRVVTVRVVPTGDPRRGQRDALRPDAVQRRQPPHLPVGERALHPSEESEAGVPRV